jgi:hypothetical protein
MKTSKDGHIAFYPETHEYFDIYGTKFKSVTTVLKKFFPFEAREISEEVRQIPSSIYFGRDAQDIRAEWVRTAPVGTALHEACEEWINTGSFPDDERRPGVQNFADFFGPTRRESLQSELVVYDAGLQMAGMLDILEDAGEFLDLWDIKTSRKIDDMKLLQYSMQLELYRRFAERNFGRPVRTRGIVWFEGYFRNPEAFPRFLKPIECQREVNALIESRKKEIRA